jgi:YidC/Oxa1 family membrane protein insertase
MNDSSEGKNILIALALCAVFYYGYNSYISKKYPRTTAETTSTETTTPNATSDASQATTPTAAAPSTSTPATIAPSQNTRLDQESLLFASDVLNLRFVQDDSSLQFAQLPRYHEGLSDESPLVNLTKSPLVVQGALNATQFEPFVGYAATRNGNTLSFSRDVEAWQISQDFESSTDAHGLLLTVRFRNISQTPQELISAVVFRENMQQAKTSGGFFSSSANKVEDSLVLSTSSGVKREVVSKFCDAENGEVIMQGQGEDIAFAGLDMHYFLRTFQPLSGKMDYVVRRASDRSGDGCPVELVLSQKQGMVAAGDSITVKFKAYLGPKNVADLNAFDPRLNDAIDLGFFGVVGQPLLKAVRWLYTAVGNYGLAIVIVTAILKLLFYPMNKSAAVSMKRMQKLQPQMQALREKHKDDPRRQQQEMMKFMSANKINPAKGCLPMLPQIPVFLAFWNVLNNAIELRQAPFFGWIKDLSAADPYYVTPLLLGAGMFMQQKMTPNPSMDKTQEKVMLMMPIIFTAMFFSMPSGMVIYMITNTVISIAQQQLINRRFV